MSRRTGALFLFGASTLGALAGTMGASAQPAPAPSASASLAPLPPAPSASAPAPEPAPLPAPPPSASAPAPSASAPAPAPSASAPTLTPAPSASSEPEPSATGFTFGLRAAYAVPFGLAKDVSFSDVVARAFVFGVDAGWTFNPHFYVGGYVLYGLATNSTTATSTCENDPSISCTATSYRFGAQAQWHFLPEEHWDPWVGAGLGYEVLNLKETDDTGADVSSAALSGFELTLQTGVSYRPRPFYGIGPYIETSLGHFEGASSATSTRGWFVFGVRLHSGI